VARRIVVTGARGFIGGHVVDHLSSRGDSVATIVVRAPCDAAALRAACDGADTVVHCAGVVSSVHPERFTTANVDATRAVAAAARATGARLVHLSSLAVAGPTRPSAPKHEEDPPAPITAYGRSKAEGERVVKTTDGLRWTILRPSVVYGPRDRALYPLFRFARAGILPSATPERTAYNFIHVSDLVRAIAAAADRGDTDGETFFVSHPDPVYPADLLRLIRDTANPRARIVPVPKPLLYLASVVGQAVGTIVGRPMTINRSRYKELVADGFVCSVDKLRDRLGIVAQIALVDGIRSTYDWYRKEHWI